MSQISINEKVFKSTVTNAFKAKSALESFKTVNLSLGQTNLKSVQEQVKVIQELYETLNLYCELLNNDLNKLQMMGDEMIQNDKNISRSMKTII